MATSLQSRFTMSLLLKRKPKTLWGELVMSHVSFCTLMRLWMLLESSPSKCYSQREINVQEGEVFGRRDGVIKKEVWDAILAKT